MRSKNLLRILRLIVYVLKSEMVFSFVASCCFFSHRFRISVILINLQFYTDIFAYWPYVEI